MRKLFSIFLLSLLSLSTSSAYAYEDDCTFFMMPDMVTMSEVRSTLMQIEFCIMDENETTTLIVSGLGGDPHAAATFYDTVKFIKQGRINVIGVGTIASAMVPIYLVGDHRSLTPNALLLIHEGSVFVNSKSLDGPAFGELKNTVEATNEIYNSILAKEVNLSVERIEEMVHEATIMTAGEAVKNGFADNIVNIK